MKTLIILAVFLAIIMAMEAIGRIFKKKEKTDLKAGSYYTDEDEMSC